MRKYIWVTVQKEFMHKYENAPENVKFLRNLHRHLFKFKIYIEVFKNDRDIEFILFKRFIEKALDNEIPFNLRNSSCESLSDFLYEIIIKKYPERKVVIEVSEDGENGVLNHYP